jgi:peroxiredoxin
LRQDFPSYATANVVVFAIAAQHAESLREWTAKHPLPFDWLSDPDRQVIKAYGVYALLSYDSFRLARPAALLIDAQGIVRFIYRSRTQWDIPSSQVMLAALDRLKQP